MEGDFYGKVGTGVRPRSDRAEVAQPSSPQSIGGRDEPAASGVITAHRWSQADDVFWPATETVEALPPAFYRFATNNNGSPVVVRRPIQIDSLIRLPDSDGAAVLAEFQQFWTLRERFVSRGFLHKRGILLWGPPGSGKTSHLMLMAADLVAAGGIVVQIESPGLSAGCLQMIRKIEPSRPIVALIEDLDALVERHGENEYLALLDGETQVDNIVYIATTNYPERLDKRFVDRPSRFDTIRWIGMPSAAARRAYLEAKEPSLKGDELERWVKKSAGYSVAHLRELVILVQCFGRDFDEAIARLDEMRERKPTNDDAPDKKPVGIMGASKGR